MCIIPACTITHTAISIAKREDHKVDGVTSAGMLLYYNSLNQDQALLEETASRFSATWIIHNSYCLLNYILQV